MLSIKACLIQHLFTMKIIMDTAHQNKCIIFCAFYLGAQTQTPWTGVIYRLQHAYHSPALRNNFIAFKNTISQHFCRYVPLKEFQALNAVYEASFPFLTFLKAFSFTSSSTDMSAIQEMGLFIAQDTRLKEIRHYKFCCWWLITGSSLVQLWYVIFWNIVHLSSPHLPRQLELKCFQFGLL